MEQKTFGELTIGDRFYVFCKSNGNSFCLIADNLRASKNKRNHLEVEDDDGDITELDCDESRYEDEDYIYTMNNQEYDKWQIPKWEKEILTRKSKIINLNVEIDEFQKHIDRAQAVAPLNACG